MRQIIIMLAVCFLGKAVMAVESNQVDHARVGQLFTLKEDVIFNEGVGEVNLYTGHIIIYSLEDKANIETYVHCELKRLEAEGKDGQCPGYPRAIVKAGKSKMIRENISGRYINDYLINILSSVKTNKCEFSYRFYCDISYNYNKIDELSAKRVVEEINYQASRLVTITDDLREPIQLP